MTKLHILTLVIGLVMCSLLACPVAHAFFLTGGFNSAQQLQIVRWPDVAMNDANHDGSINGPNEGIACFIQRGPNGFTNEEVAVLRDAFDVWQEVPTAKVGFQFINTSFEELSPVEDGINLIAWDNALPTGVFASTQLYYVIEDDPTDDIPISSGQIYECDIVFNPNVLRLQTPGIESLMDLHAAAVHVAGTFLGLGITPLNNLHAESLGGGEEEVVFYVENADVAQRDVTNVLRPVGATPTMFPMYFYTDYGDDEILPGMSDLAPDDIAAISYLYRRPGGKDNYFDLPLNAPQQIRTTTGHPNIPSAPVYGAHIVAWCDVDNDPDTPRVPLFSTMSGMYKNSEGLSGQFTIEGMLKEMETMGGAGPFQATYTITASPLNGDDDADLQRQAPPDYTAADFQSVEGAFINAAGSWLSEVFHESAKIYDISNYDVGTPLAYDSTRGYIVSADTGKTLQTILPGTRSMFGTSLDDRICPYNVVVQKAGVGGVTAGSLRHLRDGVLLKTGLGSAFARLYYSVAPWLAEQLMEHEWLLSGAATVMRATDWVLVHAGLVVKMVLGMLAFIVVLVHARRRLYMRTAMIVVLAVGLATAPATALMMRFSDEEIVTAADEVIEVTVEHVESRWMKKGSGRQIITDVTVRVEDALKGDVETGSVLTFQNLGGRVDNVVMKVEHMPTFRVGDSAILSLEKREGVGRIVFGGVQGKVDITTGSDGTRYVHKAIPEDSDAHVKSSQAATGEGTGVSVQTFKEYIREILNDAEAQP